MAVVRIVTNLMAAHPPDLAKFYREIFELDVAMDQGWIVTLSGAQTRQGVQLSLASEGGSGTELPALSIEVDDLDTIAQRLATRGVRLDYGPVQEPWGVRRFYVRDPAGHLINVLCHARQDTD